MTKDILWPEMNDIDLDNVNLQPDAAICNTSKESIDILREMFLDR